MQRPFSGVVKLTDVSDFISASQDCVVASNGSARATEKSSKEVVKISLQDCLACSGCVTSAETALLEIQSTEEFLRKLEDSEITVAVSISSQARAALAVVFDMPPIELMRSLVGFLRWVGVNLVYDMNSANDITLIAAAEEFADRYEETKRADSLPLNLVASACPGWICYVEKTHSDWCLPYLAKTRSAQATMGKILKSHLCRELSLPPERVYHCTLMSCFDKKLEAARPQFHSADRTTADVDACLTSVEMVSLIRQHLSDERCFGDFGTERDVFLDTVQGKTEKLKELYGTGGSSGGLLEYIFRSTAKRLFEIDVPAGPLPMRTLRNSNFKEIALENAEGRVLMRFASVYGFRNIQALVQKIKRRRCPYDYIEVMACPSGCTNGGGQPKLPNMESAEVLRRIEEAHDQGFVMREPHSNPVTGPFVYLDLSTGYEGVVKRTHTVVLDW